MARVFRPCVRNRHRQTRARSHAGFRRALRWAHARAGRRTHPTLPIGRRGRCCARLVPAGPRMAAGSRRRAAERLAFGDEQLIFAGGLCRRCPIGAAHSPSHQGHGVFPRAPARLHHPRALRPCQLVETFCAALHAQPSQAALPHTGFYKTSGCAKNHRRCERPAPFLQKTPHRPRYAPRQAGINETHRRLVKRGADRAIVGLEPARIRAYAKTH